MSVNGRGQEWTCRFASHQCVAVDTKPGPSLRRRAQSEKGGLNSGREATISGSVGFDTAFYLYFTEGIYDF